MLCLEGKHLFLGLYPTHPICYMLYVYTLLSNPSYIRRSKSPTYLNVSQCLMSMPPNVSQSNRRFTINVLK